LDEEPLGGGEFDPVPDDGGKGLDVDEELAAEELGDEDEWEGIVGVGEELSATLESLEGGLDSDPDDGGGGLAVGEESATDEPEEVASGGQGEESSSEEVGDDVVGEDDWEGKFDAGDDPPIVVLPATADE